MDAAGIVTVLHRFSGLDGASPAAPLIQATDGSFYGTTADGGASYLPGVQPGYGTIFTIATAGHFRSLSSFTALCADSPCTATGIHPRAALTQVSDGSFYGTTAGLNSAFATLFRMDTAGAVTAGVFANFPTGAVLQARDGHLYVTTTIGVFDLALGLVRGFSWLEPSPSGDLLQGAEGSLYGATLPLLTRGVNGTVFKIDLDSARTFTTLKAFAGPNAGFPGELFKGIDGRLYGTTVGGGPDASAPNQGYGTIFAIDPDGQLPTVHAFQLSADGGVNPLGAFAEASDGTLWGTTVNGGLGAGTVFRIAGGGVTTLYRFPLQNVATEGTSPAAGLLRASDGRFYGLTRAFGAFGQGTVFAIDEAGELTTVHHFTAGEGAPSQSSALMQASDGNFYGSTNNNIFRMDPAGVVTILHNLAANALIEVSPRRFLGTTMGDGGLLAGTVFAIDAEGTFTTLYTIVVAIRAALVARGAVEIPDTGSPFVVVLGFESPGQHRHNRVAGNRQPLQIHPVFRPHHQSQLV